MNFEYRFCSFFHKKKHRFVQRAYIHRNNWTLKTLTGALTNFSISMVLLICLRTIQVYNVEQASLQVEHTTLATALTVRTHLSTSIFGVEIFPERTVSSFYSVVMAGTHITCFPSQLSSTYNC